MINHFFFHQVPEIWLRDKNLWQLELVMSKHYAVQAVHIESLEIKYCVYGLECMLTSTLDWVSGAI